MKTNSFFNRKYQSKISLALIMMIGIAFTSCTNDFTAVSKLYVKNDVNKNLMVLVTYSSGLDTNAVISNMTPYEGVKLIDNFEDGNYNRFCGKNTDRKIYIYNVSDSTYYELKSNDFVETPSPDFVSTDNDEEVDNANQTVTYNYYVTVNDSLLVRMQKNTTLTNPLFKIK